MTNAALTYETEIKTIKESIANTEKIIREIEEIHEKKEAERLAIRKRLEKYERMMEELLK